MKSAERVAEYSVEDALENMVDRAVDRKLAHLQPQAAKRLYSVTDARIYLGRKTDCAIRELERSGRLICRRMGGRVMFELEELKAYIERETQ